MVLKGSVLFPVDTFSRAVENAPFPNTAETIHAFEGEEALRAAQFLLEHRPQTKVTIPLADGSSITTQIRKVDPEKLTIETEDAGLFFAENPQAKSAPLQLQITASDMHEAQLNFIGKQIGPSAGLGS